MDMELWARYTDHMRGKHRGRKESHSHPCCNVWRDKHDVIHMGDENPPRFSRIYSSPKPSEGTDTKSKKEYVCPRGHTFKTDSPIVIAVDNDPDYNTGPVCAYCYVDWFKVNLNADEVTEL